MTIRIDFFTHALTPKYLAELDGHGIRHHPTKPASILSDFEERTAVMDEYAPNDSSVLTMMGPDLESLVDVPMAIKLAQIGNDELADAVARYPSHFAAAAAMLPMGDMEQAVRECRRAVEELGMKGVQISSNCVGEYPSSERFYPLYEMMQEYDLPIWIHPAFPPGPLAEPFDISVMLHWPLDTSMAMFHLCDSEVFERFPRLKFVVHHAGAFIPMFAPRIKAQYFDSPPYLVKPLSEHEKKRYGYLKNFYADTAVYGDCTDSLALAVKFFGADHMVYATDFPSMTPDELPNTIRSVEALTLTPAEKQAIFSGNAKKLLRV